MSADTSPWPRVGLLSLAALLAAGMLGGCRKTPTVTHASPKPTPVPCSVDPHAVVERTRAALALHDLGVGNLTPIFPRTWPPAPGERIAVVYVHASRSLPTGWRWTRSMRPSRGSNYEKVEAWARSA